MLFRSLSRVHTLRLAGCLGVVDVSALSRVHTLVLEGCTSVVDVGALGSVRTLNLYRCTGVRVGLDSLVLVRDLTLPDGTRRK